MRQQLPMVQDGEPCPRCGDPKYIWYRRNVFEDRMAERRICDRCGRRYVAWCVVKAGNR